MTRTRHTEEQIIAVLKDAQAGVSVQDLCRKHGISDATFPKWRTKYAGLEVSDVKKLRQLEDENRRLKQMVAEQALDIQALKAITAKTGKAQGETDSGHLDGRALWAQPAASVSVSDPGSEHAPVPESSLRRLWAPGEDARDRRDQAPLRLPQDLRAAAAGRLDSESQEGRANLSGGRALVAPPSAEEGHGRPPRRTAAAQPARPLLCDGLCP